MGCYLKKYNHLDKKLHLMQKITRNQLVIS